MYKIKVLIGCIAAFLILGYVGHLDFQTSQLEAAANTQATTYVQYQP